MVPVEDVVASGVRRGNPANRVPRIALAGGLVAAAAVGTVCGAVFLSRGGVATAVLSCNSPLPGGVLNVNVSWGVGADTVTLDAGDGRVIQLDPDVADNQRLSDMIRHRYETPGRYEVTLLSRSGGSEARAQCTFVAAL
jgi:hypothetical protein